MRNFTLLFILFSVKKYIYFTNIGTKVRQALKRRSLKMSTSLLVIRSS